MLYSFAAPINYCYEPYIVEELHINNVFCTLFCTHCYYLYYTVDLLTVLNAISDIIGMKKNSTYKN